MNPLKKDGDRYVYKGHDFSTRKVSTRKERTITAYHEAGHAVVAASFGMRVKSVDIIQNDDLGRAGFCGVRTTVWHSETRAFLMFVLGGPVAEFVHRCRGLRGAINISCVIRHYGSVLNVLRAMGGGDFETIDPSVSDETLLSLVADTAGLIATPERWARLDAVAKALLERQKISGDELSDIYFAVRKPSRVDLPYARKLLGASGSFEDIRFRGHLPWRAV